LLGGEKLHQPPDRCSHPITRQFRGCDQTCYLVIHAFSNLIAITNPSFLAIA
jgi:hypothetical protein